MGIDVGFLYTFPGDTRRQCAGVVMDSITQRLPPVFKTILFASGFSVEQGNAGLFPVLPGFHHCQGVHEVPEHPVSRDQLTGQ